MCKGPERGRSLGVVGNERKPEGLQGNEWEQGAPGEAGRPARLRAAKASEAMQGSLS